MKNFISKFKNIQLAHFYLIVALTFGMLIIFINPPFEGPDEPSHFHRAMQISNGHIIPEVIDNTFAITLPEQVLKMESDLTKDIPLNYLSKFHAGLIKEYIFEPRSGQNTYIQFGGAPIYLPFTYIPQCLAIIISNIFQFPFLITFYLARIFNLIFSTLITFLAIKTMPGKKFKLIVALVALMPMTLYLTTTVGPDALITSSTFLIISLVLKARINQTLSKKTIFILLLLCLLLAFSKQAYLGIPLFCLLLPRNVFKTKWTYLATVACLSFVPIVIYQVLSFYIQDKIPAVNAGMIGYLKSILYNLDTFGLYLKDHLFLYSAIHFEEFLGRLGWVDTRIPMFLVLYPYSIILAIAMLYKPDLRLDKTTKIISGLILIGSIALVYVGLYILWNLIDGNGGSGVQGRYFIPIAIFLPLILNSSKYYIEIKASNKMTLFMIFMIYVEIFTLISIIIRYYVPG